MQICLVVLFFIWSIVLTITKTNNMKREIAVNQIVTLTSYIRIFDGSVEYDFEMMAEEFENELSKLDDSVVIMVSVEGK